MRLISANRIYTGKGGYLKNQVIAMDDTGLVTDIKPLENFESADIEPFVGVIVPGFINAHCHLELSHMKGKLETGTGLLSFIGNVVKQRGATEEQIQEAIYEANTEMFEKGIVAVGDISNQGDTFKCKEESLIQYYTFVEMFDFLQPEMTQSAIEQYENVLAVFQQSEKNKTNLTPHAPYSVSPILFEHINAQVDIGSTISIHNQETPPEDELFLKGTGAFHDFYKSFGLNLDQFKSLSKTAIHYPLNEIGKDRKMLFVHNTLSSGSDIKEAQKICSSVYWATCPNANLYIENSLPDYKLFLDAGAKVCIGTDSLTSNWQLDIMEEIKAIKKYNSYISFEQLIEWACKNGAEALGYEDQLGTIEIGKRPGLVHIDAQLFEEEPDISEAMAMRIF